MEAMFRFAWAFNRDIGDWAVARVTNMMLMFNNARDFNQDIGAWTVGSVTNMQEIFSQAWAFDQDLGWCVDDNSVFDACDWCGRDDMTWAAFYRTPCASTSCGVTQGGCP